jgi:hypothetical protein
MRRVFLICGKVYVTFDDTTYFMRDKITYFIKDKTLD